METQRTKIVVRCEKKMENWIEVSYCFGRLGNHLSQLCFAWLLSRRHRIPLRTAPPPEWPVPVECEGPVEDPNAHMSTVELRSFGVSKGSGVPPVRHVVVDLFLLPTLFENHIDGIRSLLRVPAFLELPDARRAQELCGSGEQGNTFVVHVRLGDTLDPKTACGMVPPTKEMWKDAYDCAAREEGWWPGGGGGGKPPQRAVVVSDTPGHPIVKFLAEDVLPVVHPRVVVVSPTESSVVHDWACLYHSRVALIAASSFSIFPLLLSENNRRVYYVCLGVGHPDNQSTTGSFWLRDKRFRYIDPEQVGGPDRRSMSYGDMLLKYRLREPPGLEAFDVAFSGNATPPSPPFVYLEIGEPQRVIRGFTPQSGKDDLRVEERLRVVLYASVAVALAAVAVCCVLCVRRAWFRGGK